MILGDLDLARHSNVIPFYPIIAKNREETAEYTETSPMENDEMIPLGDWYKLNAELLRKMIGEDRTSLTAIMTKTLPHEIQPAIENIFFEKLDKYFSRKTVKYITMCVAYGNDPNRPCTST